MKDKNPIEVVSPGDKCVDLGRQGCLETPDEQYTVSFNGTGEDPVKYCSVCGPKNIRLKEALEKAFCILGPEFAQKFRDGLAATEDELKSKSS